MQLNAHEARVLGVLIEKAFTTPEQYPQTLNAITNGCNQKSCRIPVLDFSQAEVTVSLSGLQMKQLAGGSFPAGSRVEKWHHSALEHFSLGFKELALLAELLLRGPQSPSELRAHASRMHPVAKEEISSSLGRLEDKQLVRFLASGAGARTERWTQTLAPELSLDGEPEPASAPRPSPSQSTGPNFDPVPRAPAARDRVAELETRVERLESQLRALATELGAELTD